MSPKLAVADPRVAAFCWKQQITVDLIKVTNNTTGTLNNEFNIVILLLFYDCTPGKNGAVSFTPKISFSNDSSYAVSVENSAFDQLIIFLLIFFSHSSLVCLIL